MSKFSFRERCSYWIDRLLGSSFNFHVVSLILATLMLVLVGGLVVVTVNPANESLSQGVWWSFLHFLDPGFLENDFGFLLRILAIFLVFSGWIIFGLLISFISTGIQERMELIRKGNSPILDRNHTVILGWGNTIFSILDQLYSEDENRRSRVVILSQQDPDEVHIQIAKYCLNRKSSKRTLVRKGSIESVTNLRRVNVPQARDVIILEDRSDDQNEIPDSKTLKSILAIRQVITQNISQPVSDSLTVVASISTPRTRKMLPPHFGENSPRKIDLLMVEEIDVLARLITQCAAQPGLSMVFQEILSYQSAFFMGAEDDSSEIYCVPIQETEIPIDTPFDQCFCSLGSAIALGYLKKSGELCLNPRKNSEASTYKLNAHDLIIALADRKSDIVWKPREVKTPQIGQHARLLQARCILLFGAGKKSLRILRELPSYLPAGSTLFSFHDPVLFPKSTRVQIEHLDSQEIEELLENPQRFRLGDIDTVILADDSLDRDIHDTRVLAFMMAIRTKGHELQKHAIVVAEILDPRNRELAHAVDVRELIVSTEKVSHYMVQLSRDPFRAQVFSELLDSDGMEFYLRHPPSYISEEQKEVTFDELAAVARERNEIALGYLHSSSKKITLCPRNPSRQIPIPEIKSIVVLSEK